MSADQFGRQALAEAWHTVFGEHPTLAEIQMAQAVARGESNYGQAAFKNLETGETRVINNWGAVQASKVPCGPDGFEATDHHADGTPYQVCFRVYPTAAAGAEHFLKVLLVQRPSVREVIGSGNVDAVAHRMRASKYFELAEDKYANAIWKNIQAIATNLGEPLTAFRGDPEATGDGTESPLPQHSSQPGECGQDSSSPNTSGVIEADFVGEDPYEDS